MPQEFPPEVKPVRVALVHRGAYRLLNWAVGVDTTTSVEVTRFE